MDDAVRMSLAEVHEASRRALLAKGFSPPHAEAIAATMTAAERDGSHHHGLFRLAFYASALEAGQASPDAEPTFEDLAPGVIRCDAGGAFAPLALELSAPRLVERARSPGIAALALNDALPVAPLGIEVERLAAEGLAAFAFVCAIPYVAPHGGTRPVFGTNPVAFGWPRPDRPPLVIDMASSMSARGEIQIRMRDGRSLPEGWAIDADGRPTTDPKAALAGAQLPFGGAKGSAIALMVELLAGPLVGDVISLEAGERDPAKTGAPRGGELVIAMDPARFTRGGDLPERLARGERLFRAILEQEGTRLPGDRRYASRARAEREGVLVPRSIHDSLVALAAGAGYARQPWEGDPASPSS